MTSLKEGDKKTDIISNRIDHVQLFVLTKSSGEDKVEIHVNETI